MRIAINAMFLIPGRVGGSETYIRGLVKGLISVDGENDYILIVGREAAVTFSQLTDRWRVIVSPVPSADRRLRLLAEQTWLPVTARRLHVDLLHSAGYTAPLTATVRSVASILDMNYRRHPEDLSLSERLVYAALIPRVARRANHVLTLSEAARADIVRWTHTPPSKVTAVPLSPRSNWPGDPRDDDARLASAGVSVPFVLSVAASYPHKNLRRLMAAFPVHDAGGHPVQLVLVGLKGRAQADIDAAGSMGNDQLKVLGWVDDSLLAALYRNAVALAFPSLYEGFGLPILEAMACGTAVLTSNVGAMAEVAGRAAELVDPTDVNAIRQGLSRIVQDQHRREELRQLGLRRASEFSWEKTASMTREVYERFGSPG